MEMSESFWPEDLELAVLAVHDIARSRQNSLLLLVVLDSDFHTQLGDFLPQILQPGICGNRRSLACQDHECANRSTTQDNRKEMNPHRDPN